MDYNNNQFGQQQTQQQAQPQQTYQQPQTTYTAPNYGAAPQYQVPVDPANLEPVSIGTWLGIMFLSLIPCVGFILLFVWAFGDGKESRKNWAKAQLIFMAIMIVLSIILYAILGATLYAALSNFYF